MLEDLSKVLVIDDSTVFREMLKIVLAPHCEKVLTAASVQEGVKALVENRDVALVISDVIMPEVDGFGVLRYVGSLDDPKPRVILVTGRPVEGDEERAMEMGAIGYLTKPASFRDIGRVLRKSQAGTWNAGRPVRCRTLGKAFLVDPEDRELSHLAWEIRDLSNAGAFVEAKAPLPVGMELDLALVFGSGTAHVRAEVVRVQEPSWGAGGGVGIVFREFQEGGREVLETQIADAADELY